MPADGPGLAQIDAEEADRIDRPEALGAVRDVEGMSHVVDQDAHDLAEPERHDGQVIAAQLQRGRAQQHAEQRGQQGAQGNRDPPGRVQAERKHRRDPREVLDQVRRRQQGEHIGAHGVEGDVAQVQQAGVAHHDVHAERHQHIQQAGVGDANPMRAEALQQKGQQQERGDGGTFGVLAGRVHAGKVRLARITEKQARAPFTTDQDSAIDRTPDG